MSPDERDLGNRNGADVLSSLPHHRPGRRTNRRPAAAAAASDESTSDGATKTDARAPARAGGSSRGGGGGAQHARSRSRKRSAATVPAPLASGARPIAIPEQGFEVEEEVRVGSAVEPPSRLDLVTSIFELIGEAAEDIVKTGVSAGGSLLRRTLDLVPKR